jgi:hypothetical protein
LLLPEWFSALNKDFRYQLTPVGGAAPNLHIKEKVNGNRFKISGGAAGIEVSWQLTGIRQDKWANANRIPVEEVKPVYERGKYLHPLEHGKPESLELRDDAARALEQHDEMQRARYNIMPNTVNEPIRRDIINGKQNQQRPNGTP